MKTKIKKMFAGVGVASILTTLIPVHGVAASDKLVYPLQTISKLACRFTEFGELQSNCKQQLPILHTKDYKKYAKQGGGYNDYTRLYTVLWGASYKYGWDQGYGGHMGVDVATAQGTPVYSMAKGKVIKAGWNSGGFGNLVSVKHTINGKTIVSSYAHLHKISVSVGDTVSPGQKVGEVGSTGNSTGNHLHFQIDTKTTYSPIYYSRKTCPYSYYEITEKGHCFDELSRITVDPLKFLETNGAILDAQPVKYKTKKKTTTKKTTKVTTIKKKVRADKVVKGDIFTRTVYRNYDSGDIRKVQQIYKSLGYYDGEITSNYRDVEESVIAYQIDKGVISDRSADGAGWFGPKTRAQTKKDWDKFVAEGGTIVTTVITGTKASMNEDEIFEDDRTLDEQIEVIDNDNVSIKTEKIERRNLMTVEEREAKEVNDFLKKYKIDLRFVKPGGNIEKGATEVLKLTITDKRGRKFRGNMPGNMTFIANSNMVNVFPKKLFYFTDGKRDIKIKGLQEGTTTLYVKIGKVTVNQFKLKVYNGNKSVVPSNARIIAPSTSSVGDSAKGIVVFRDNAGKNLVNLHYKGDYKIKASAGNKICVKRGTLKTIKNTYNSSCEDVDFQNEITFDYSDTIAGLLLFDLKAINDDANYEIVKVSGNKKLARKSVRTTTPKGLSRGYAYKDEVMNSLKNGITTAGVERGYFLQDRELTEKDAYAWIINSLEKMQEDNIVSRYSGEIQENIKSAKEEEKNALSRTGITRAELLEMAYTYLVFSPNSDGGLDFQDLDENTNTYANSIFTTDTTWKDKFGQTHFRPASKVTRGEGAYLILNAMKRNAQERLVTLK